MTLKQVEIKSRGRWKSVVVGSYERGTRSLSVARAAELCDFYGVPLRQLFIDDNISETKRNLDFVVENHEPWRIDLRQLREIHNAPDEFSLLIFKFLQQISIKRDDWNGEVLTIRKHDLETLSLLTQRDIVAVKKAFDFRGLLIQR